MSKEPDLEVVSVERIDGTEIIVEFSDSTCAMYTPLELAALKPHRKEVNSPGPGRDSGGTV
jgi:hypothetical protein